MVKKYIKLNSKSLNFNIFNWIYYMYNPIYNYIEMELYKFNIKMNKYILKMNRKHGHNNNNMRNDFTSCNNHNALELIIL